VFTKVSVTSFRLLKHIGAKCATTTKAQKTIKKNPNSNACCRYVVADGSDAHRATQDIFFVILNQFLKPKKHKFQGFWRLTHKKPRYCGWWWWWFLLLLLVVVVAVVFVVVVTPAIFFNLVVVEYRQIGCVFAYIRISQKKHRKCIFFYTWETEDHGISDVFYFWWEEVRYLQWFLGSTEQKHWYLHSFGHVARNDFPMQKSEASVDYSVLGLALRFVTKWRGRFLKRTTTS
jgi:hypothetical protein